MRRNDNLMGIIKAFMIPLMVLLLIPHIAKAEYANMGYLDYLDSYYTKGSLSDLEAAKNSIKTELDSSLALKIQSYYYNAEIEYLLAYEKLRNQPLSEEHVQDLKNLLVELYHRYLESYYHFLNQNIENTNLEGNTAYLFKDIFLAAPILPSANSISPLVKNLLRRASRENLYNPENSFVASVSDLFAYEEPNLFGMSNLIKAVWAYDRYMQSEEVSVEKDSLRQLVNYHSAIAIDTLSSNFGKSISCFLLATTNSNRENDAAWTYFQKCLELSKEDSKFPQAGFYAKNYNKQIYLATTVAFLPAYCEYLYGNGRFTEILDATEYMVDLDMLDKGMLENVSKEAIFWGEKSLRALQDEGRYQDSDDMYRRLHAFYKFVQPKGTYSDQPDN